MATGGDFYCGVLSIFSLAVTGVPDGVVNLSGRCSIPLALAALAECDLVVSVDSGLLYAGAALGKPVVGIFTHIGALQRLWLARRFIALEPALPCAPCGEAEGALHCRRGSGTAEQPFRLACAQLDFGSSVAAAAERLLCNPGMGVRDVWRVGPLADRVELAVQRIPAPWSV